MNLYGLSLIFIITLLVPIKQKIRCSNVVLGANFYDNYKFTWGFDHIRSNNQGNDVQIFLDQSSGAGFESKRMYGSGFFHMDMKLPGKNSAGVVTSFYLISESQNQRNEMDFEFLGNKEGKPIYLQTNIFINGKGDREQRIKLWFDPSSDFHRYSILWNQEIVVFFVNEYPIRVFENNRHTGVGYPSKPMKIAASIWNGESWATEGGMTKINWAYAPFTASYRDFNVDGCVVYNNDMNACSTRNYWWNGSQYWSLTLTQLSQYEFIRKKYMTYDYCTDKNRYYKPPPECQQ